MGMELRPYQREAVDALVGAWEEGLARSAMIAATGSGKTVTFSHLITQVRREYGIAKVLVIAHREELLTQAQATINKVAPRLRVEIMQGGSTSATRMAKADVVVASIQTLAYRRPCRHKIVKRRGQDPVRCGNCVNCTRLPNTDKVRDVGAIICDEAHHASAPTYKQVFDWYGAFDDKLPVWGFTATMTREQGGLAKVWQKTAYTIGLQELVDDGYLVKPHAKQVRIPGMDLDQAKVRHGDFTTQSLAELMLEGETMDQIAEAYQDYASDRPGLVFCPDIETTMAMADAFNKRNITAEPVWGTMKSDDRHQTLKRFKHGDTQVLINCMVLTEGFDEPKASCIVIARPTKSRGLYAQMIGRGMRTSPDTGKQDLLILDVHGATTRHTLATLDDVTEGRGDEDESDSKPGDDEEEEDKPAALDDESGAMPVMKDPLQIAGWADVEDLFGSGRKKTPIRWLCSPGGIWFAPMGEEGKKVVSAILPSAQGPGLVDLWGMYSGGVYCRDNCRGLTMQQVTDMLKGVQAQYGTRLDDPGAPWRRKPATSAKQRDYANRIVQEMIPPDPTVGQMSDLIDKYKIGRIVDGALQQAVKGA